jgi:hypothetical protein
MDSAGGFCFFSSSAKTSTGEESDEIKTNAVNDAILFNCFLMAFY